MSKSSRVLWVVYGLSFIVCGCLTFIQFDKWNASINLCFFLIVGYIFIYATKKLKKLNKYQEDVDDAINILKENQCTSKESLVDYCNKEELFEEEELNQSFSKFLSELDAIEKIGDKNIKCSIDDYVSYELFDRISQRSILELVPGIMTGLGILGTFVGLSFGLQSFDITSANAVSDSIMPLMGGIKVAFYTSIFGILFSLVFNYIYKKDTESADYSLIGFQDYISDIVSNLSENEVLNLLLGYQKNQTETLNNLFDNFSHSIGEVLTDVLGPELQKMNNTIESFAEVASQEQKKGLDKIVNNFVDEMNNSLGENFKALGDSVAETTHLQEQNTKEMRELISSLDSVINNVEEVNKASEHAINDLSTYIDELKNMQGIINENFMSVNVQNEINNSIINKHDNLIKELMGYEKKISDATKIFGDNFAVQLKDINSLKDSLAENALKSISELSKSANDNNKLITESTRQQIEKIVDLSDSTTKDMNRATEELSSVVRELNSNMDETLNRTFMSFDEQLAQITQHLSGTISQIDKETEKVPAIVHQSYFGIEKGLNELSDKLSILVSAVDKMNNEINQPVITKNEGVE